ncbi:hypothetical protein RRF57_006468 [Xylaria bambusicola]|uniref:Uncharacterized protein n=1 Tax=Xylaria bambusicola TaxID=326684 RepID=A0AAN7UQD3_9PEZI
MFSKSTGQIIARMRNRTLSARLTPRSGLQVRARFSSTQAPNEPRPTGSLDVRSNTRRRFLLPDNENADGPEKCKPRKLD